MQVNGCVIHMHMPMLDILDCKIPPHLITYKSSQETCIQPPELLVSYIDN